MTWYATGAALGPEREAAPTRAAAANAKPLSAGGNDELKMRPNFRKPRHSR